MENSSTPTVSIPAAWKTALTQFYLWGLLPWLIVVGGAIVRLRLFAEGCSMWMDETMLALNFPERTFLELIQPLDHDQVAPLGFLFVSKAIIVLFGNNEYTLRLFPMLSGVLSLTLFCLLAKRWLPKAAVPLAVMLFAVSPNLILYVGQCKQYSGDVAATVAMLLATDWISRKRLTMPRALAYASLGAVLIWFSHPVALVMAGAGLILAWNSYREQDFARLLRLVGVGSFWVINLGVLYVITLKDSSQSDVMQDFWKGTFMPFPPSSLRDVNWFWRSFFRMFESPGGFAMTGLAAAMFLVGCLAFYEANRVRLAYLLAPFAITLLASALHLYPFGHRLLLFTVPLTLLLIAAGVHYLCRRTQGHPGFLAVVVAALLLFHPAFSAARTMKTPPAGDDIRPVLRYLGENMQPGDTVYIDHWGRYPLEHYHERFGLKKSYIEGSRSPGDWRVYLDDLDALRGNSRVWVILCHLYTPPRKAEYKLFTSYLDTIGVKLDEHSAHNAHALLYDLSRLPE